LFAFGSLNVAFGFEAAFCEPLAENFQWWPWRLSLFV